VIDATTSTTIVVDARLQDDDAGAMDENF